MALGSTGIQYLRTRFFFPVDFSGERPKSLFVGEGGREASLNERYYSASLCRCARVSFVEFQAASPTAKQDPHFQQVL